MYKRAAELFANDLYDELISTGILDDPDIRCGQTDMPISLTDTPEADRNFILWQIDSEWSDRGEHQGFRYCEDAKRILSLYERELEGRLSKDEYAWLAEHGYIKTNGDYNGYFKDAWQCVVLASKEIQDKLLAIGERIKVKYRTDFEALKVPYAEAILKSVPAHLRRLKAYELQFLFHSDGWFLLHCIVCLLKNGKLKEPTEGQRKALTTLILKTTH